MRIIITYFIITIMLSLLFLYFYHLPPQIVFKYPDPANDISDIYIDNNNIKYFYIRKEYND